MTYSNKEINRLTPTNEDTVGPYYPHHFVKIIIVWI